jgi:hypothetical protein
MEPVALFEQQSDTPTIELNIIESAAHIDLDSFECPESAYTGRVHRINLVIPDWCESTCAYKGTIFF